MSERLRSLPFRILTPAVALAMIGSGVVILLAEAGGDRSGPSTRARPEIGGPGVTEISVEGTPRHLVVGQGTVWLVRKQEDRSALVTIDPASNTVVGEPIELDGEAWGLAAGEDAVWILTDPPDPAEPDRVVLRFDPASARVTATIPVGRQARGVGFGGGAVWVANVGDGTVSRIDPLAGRVAATIDTGGAPETVLASNSGVWVNSLAGGSELVRIDPASNTVVERFPEVQALSLGKTFVWAADPEGVVRIRPQTNELFGERYPIDTGPAFAASLSGTVWIGRWFDQGDRGTFEDDAFQLFRLDPTTMTEGTTPIPVDYAATRPVAGLGALWVASRAKQAVLRIDPAAVEVRTSPSPPGSPSPTGTN